MSERKDSDVRIGFDARMVCHSGIGSHIRGLVHSMVCERRKYGIEFEFLGDPDILRRYRFFDRGGTIHPCHAGIYSLREQLLFPQLKGAHACHFPHYNVPRRLRPRFFVTIHDLTHLLFPEFMGSQFRWLAARSMVRSAAKRALAVFTVSEWSRDDIVRELPVPPERVFVIPNALPGSFKPVSAPELDRFRREMKLETPFLLAVGLNKPHKNFRFLIEAFLAWVAASKPIHRLVICGMRESDEAALGRFVAERDGGDRIRLIHYLEHERMPALYQCADALVFPSLHEGFGIPILEAQRLGVPVVCSNAASMPEVAGDGALYFDPRSHAEFSARLTELVGNDGLRKRLVQRGGANVTRFDWRESALRTLEVYRRFI